PGVSPSANVVTLVTNNNAGTSGGGLNQSGGSLAITIATFSDNQANGGDGGGLNFTGGNPGTLVAPLQRVTVSNNTASGNGGGIANSGTSLFVNDFTISGNNITGVGDGGGFASVGVQASSSIINTTIANNTGNGAGGVSQTAGAMTIGNTLVGDNAGTDIRLIAAPVELSPNLFETFSGFVPVGTDITGIDAVLAPLADYGGGTHTIALLPGSPAINAGTGASGNDQRGVSAVGVRDIGAFESRGFTITGSNSLTTIVSTVFQQTTVPGSTSQAHVTANVTAVAPGEPVVNGKVTFSANTSASGGTALFTSNSATIDAMGVATSGDITANQYFGTYDPLASANGAMTADIGTLINRGVDSIQYIVAPTDTLSGKAIPTITVQLFDQFGAPLAIDGRNIKLTFSYNPAVIAPGFVPKLRGGSRNGPVVVGTNGGSYNRSTGNLNPGPNGDGIASFANLFLNTTGRYTFSFTATRDSIQLPTLTTAISTTFNIRASRLKLTNVDATRFPGQRLNNITVTAVGVDGSRDLFFTSPITLSFATAPAGGHFIKPIPPAVTVTIIPNPGKTPRAFPHGGRVTIGNFGLNREGLYTLKASSFSILEPSLTSVQINGIASKTTRVIPTGGRRGLGRRVSAQ
ncbi:MAG: choice-of-anchor Q domain-containing protein, partial [Gemmataceae bacterium]